MKKALFAIAAMALMQNACSTTPKANPHFKVGKPYSIGGKVYYPTVEPKYSKIGLASWYGPKFDKKLTANGEIFDRNLMTAAHKTLPLPSIAKVTNLENGRSIYVRVNDRGPYVGNRIIDLSERAAEKLGFKGKGTAKVLVELDRAASSTALNSVRISDSEKKFVLSQLQVVTGEEAASKLQATSTAQEGQIQSTTANLGLKESPAENKVAFVSAKGSVGMVADNSGKIGEVAKFEPKAQPQQNANISANSSIETVKQKISSGAYNNMQVGNNVNYNYVTKQNSDKANSSILTRKTPASIMMKNAIGKKYGVDQPAYLQASKKAEIAGVSNNNISNTNNIGKAVYYVQVKASKDKIAAENEASKLAGKYSSKVEEALVKGVNYYRVRLGGYSSKQEAENIRNAAKNLGYKDAYVVKKNI